MPDFIGKPKATLRQPGFSSDFSVSKKPNSTLLRNKGISLGQDKRYKMICLSDNVPTMMAYANDLSYSDVFLGPLQNFYNEGDVVLGISGSGNSSNVVKALEWANEHGAVTIAFTGYDGGKMKQIAQYGVHIPVNDMQIAEDLHMMLDQCIMKILSLNCGC